MSTDLQLRQLFECCIDQHADSMYRVAYRLTGQRELATELVQECYLQAWQNIGSLRDQEKMRAWMFSILRNQYLKLQRNPKQSQLESADETVVDQRTLLAAESKVEQQAMIQGAIEQRDDSLKLPILLVSMEGLSAETAAEILTKFKGFKAETGDSI